MKIQQLLTRRERNEILVAKAVTKFRLSQRDGESCNRCKVRMYCSDLTIDHIHPKFLGGNEELANKQLLCLRCHKRKTRNEYYSALARGLLKK